MSEERPSEVTPERVAELDERLKNLETGLLAVQEGKFEPDVYRKALQLSVQDHVYSRLRNIIWIVTLLAGLGLTYLAVTTIEAAAEKAVVAHNPEFHALQAEARREILISSLNEAWRDLGSGKPPEGSFAVQRIRDRGAEFRELVVGFLEEGSRHERMLAASYAGAVADRTLHEAMLNAARDAMIPASDRAEVFRAILRSGDEELRHRFRKEVLDPELEGFENGGLSPAAREIMFAVVREDVREDWSINLLLEGLASGNRELERACLRFVAVNHDLLSADHAETLARKLVGRQEYQWVVKLFPARSGGGAPLSEEVHESAANFLAREESLLRKLGDEGEKAFEKVRRGLALALLRGGRPELFEEVMSSGYYPWDTWLAHVAPIFPDFEYDETEAEAEEGQLAIEDRLYFELDLHEWDPTRRAYQYVEPELPPGIQDWASAEMALEALEAGDFDPYIDFMRRSYFEDEVWETAIRPRFPDAEEIGESGDPFSQDRLWHWVETRRGDLAWDTGAKTFRLPETDDR